MTGSVLLLIAVSMMVLALCFAWWRVRARVYLVRSLSEDTPNLKYLGVARSAREILFDGLTLHRTAQQMRQRYEVDTRDVDAVKTIEATLRSGGLPHYVYRKQLVLPEYLALIDKHDADDHHSRFVDEILRRLEASDVAITRYYFSKDPRTCFASGLYGIPDTLAHLAQIHDKKRLLDILGRRPFD